jgi:hypothetical protein
VSNKWSGFAWALDGSSALCRAVLCYQCFIFMVLILHTYIYIYDLDASLLGFGPRCNKVGPDKFYRTIQQILPNQIGRHQKNAFMNSIKQITQLWEWIISMCYKQSKKELCSSYLKIWCIISKIQWCHTTKQLKQTQAELQTCWITDKHMIYYFILFPDYPGGISKR